MNFNNRIEYIITHPNERDVLTEAPEMGADSGGLEFSRNVIYDGIIAKHSGDVKFIKEGANHLRYLWSVYDALAKPKLIIRERHPHTDEWIESFDYLDMLTYTDKIDHISIQFGSGGIETLLKSRDNEKIELDRLTTLNGSELPELKTETVLYEGRNIFLETTYEDTPLEVIDLYNNTSAGNERGCLASAPMKIKNKSHDNAVSPFNIVHGDNSTLRTGDGTTGVVFFADNDIDRVLEVKFKGNFSAKSYVYQNIKKEAFYVMLKTYSNGSAYNYKSNVILFDNYDIKNLNGQVYNFEYSGTIVLLKGESLALTYEQHMEGRVSYDSAMGIKISETNIEYFSIKENSQFPQTKSKFILAKESANRIVSIITNKQDIVKSDFLGRLDLGYSKNGQASFTGITHGHWVRGFDKLPIPSENPEVVNLFKPLTTSMRDFMQSFSAIWDLSMGIEKIGRKEIVRLEKKTHFFSNNVTVRLGEVKVISRKPAIEYYYKSIEAGQEESVNYDEIMGLDEPNGKSNYTTVMDVDVSTLLLTSKYRTDKNGQELTRRKPFDLNPTEDTSRDASIWMNDLKKNPLENFYRERYWQDDLQEPPKGIFSPETATNLRYSPLNILLRHKWFIAASLIKYPMDFIRYGSSNANSQLATKLRTDASYKLDPNATMGNGLEYKENGDVQNSELGQARFKPEWVEFEKEVTFEVLQQIKGETVINGKTVVNIYGLIEFNDEKGFLFNVKTDGVGQWKILTSNRI